MGPWSLRVVQEGFLGPVRERLEALAAEAARLAAGAAGRAGAEAEAEVMAGHDKWAVGPPPEPMAPLALARGIEARVEVKGRHCGIKVRVRVEVLARGIEARVEVKGRHCQDKSQG